MRKVIQFIIFSFPLWGSGGFTFAQSSTLLPNAVELPKFAINPACTVTEKGRLIYNTTDNKSYFCNGTAWVDMTVGGFSLPYSGSGSVTAPNILFNVSNSANGRAISGETTSPTYGTGVYGASTSTAPSSSSPSTTGVFGINYSQNSNGLGIYGQHDGSGKGIYGVVKNSGIGVHGIGLPVGSGGNGNGIGVKGESTGNYGVFGVSTNHYGVYGLSTQSYGVYGVSTNSYGVYGKSTNHIGVYGVTDDSYAGVFYNTSNTASTIYANNYGTGKVAELIGDAEITNNLTVGNNLTVDGNIIVNSNKGIVISQDATQLKIVRFTGGFALNIGANGHLDTAINYPNFSGIPTVTIGQYEGGTGDWQCLKIIPFNVTSTSCSIKVMNGCSTSMNGSATIHFLIVGPK